MKDTEEEIISRLKGVGYSHTQANSIYFRYSAWDRIPDLAKFIKDKEKFKIENAFFEEYME